MAITEISLMPALSREMGDVDQNNLYYTSNVLYSAINDGIQEFNLSSPNQQYTVIGSGDTAYISPAPDVEDQRLIILYAALCLTNGEIQKSARTAFTHSNPAGSTNLTRITEYLIKQAERIQDKIDNAFTSRTRTLVEAELDESGVELKGRSNSSDGTEGVGIITIETTN